MPTVFNDQGFKFYFYSNEGNPREPVHIHVRGSGGEAKFWVGKEILHERSDGFDAKTLRKLNEMVKENRQRIEEKWNDYFG